MVFQMNAQEVANIVWAVARLSESADSECGHKALKLLPSLAERIKEALEVGSSRALRPSSGVCGRLNTPLLLGED